MSAEPTDRDMEKAREVAHRVLGDFFGLGESGIKVIAQALADARKEGADGRWQAISEALDKGYAAGSMDVPRLRSEVSRLSAELALLRPLVEAVEDWREAGLGEKHGAYARAEEALAKYREAHPKP